MTTVYPSVPQPRHLAAIAASLAVHALLIGLWQLSRPAAVPDDEQPRRVQFLRLLPAPAAPAPEAVPRPPARPAPAAARAAPALRTPSRRPEPAMPTPDAIVQPAPPVTEAPAALPSAADLLQGARASVGAIDRALRKEHPTRGIHAPVESVQTKLEKGIARASDLAPNKWYQAPKVEEIVDPGQYGRKRYKVVGAAGTYCVTYESNHAPDGRDSMRDGIPPKLTSCPKHEEPAKAQKWE